jgi:hypothetical protein
MSSYTGALYPTAASDDGLGLLDSEPMKVDEPTFEQLADSPPFSAPAPLF